MCDNSDRLELPLSFEQFVAFLSEPPHEPCESEFTYMPDYEYYALFSETERGYHSPVISYIASIVRDYDKAADLAQEVTEALIAEPAVRVEGVRAVEDSARRLLKKHEARSDWSWLS